MRAYAYVMMALCALCAGTALAADEALTIQPAEIIDLEQQLRGLGLAPGTPMHMKSAPEGTQGPLLIGYAPNQSPGGKYPVFIVEVDVAPALGQFLLNTQCRVSMRGIFANREGGTIYTTVNVAMSPACAPADLSESAATQASEIIMQVYLRCLRFVSQTIRNDKNGVKAL